jgi:hypothetical protein
MGTLGAAGSDASDGVVKAVDGLKATTAQEALQNELNAEQKKQAPSFSSARGGAKEREETRSRRTATATETQTETRGVALVVGRLVRRSMAIYYTRSRTVQNRTELNE